MNLKYCSHIWGCCSPNSSSPTTFCPEESNKTYRRSRSSMKTCFSRLSPIICWSFPSLALFINIMQQFYLRLKHSPLTFPLNLLLCDFFCKKNGLRTMLRFPMCYKLCRVGSNSTLKFRTKNEVGAVEIAEQYLRNTISTDGPNTFFASEMFDNIRVIWNK